MSVTNPNFTHFFKLGHQSNIGIAEFEFQTQSQDLVFDSQWLLTNTYFNPISTGSIVYGGKVVGSWDLRSDFENNFYQSLLDFLSDESDSTSKFKKLGLAFPEWLQEKSFKIAKRQGAKKINLLKSRDLPNYGHWKQTKNWLISFEFNGRLFLGHILGYSDQEFWNILDTNLPFGDMHRGIMNLKLGRSLLNLTSKNTIWDPFCGQGRLIMSGLDRKESFIASDIDYLEDQVRENYEFSYDFFQKNYRSADKLDIAKLTTTFTADAGKDNQKKLPTNLNLQNIAVVTEGWLGYNFRKQPTQIQIQNEFQNIEYLWEKVLYEFKTMGISEIIFCLPFYKQDGEFIFPNFIFPIIQKNGYKSTFFGAKNYLLYTRKDSIVGHFILKITIY